MCHVHSIVHAALITHYYDFFNTYIIMSNILSTQSVFLFRQICKKPLIDPGIQIRIQYAS